MKRCDHDQRMAAWLLMLPGPWTAASLAEALREAKRLFDPQLSVQQFEAALHRFGYALVAKGGVYAILPQLPDFASAAAHPDRQISSTA